MGRDCPSEQVIIRPARGDDAGDLYQVRMAEEAAAETLAVPGTSFERFSEGLDDALVDKNNYLLVAELGGRVVGMANLQVLRGRRRHCGLVGMAVHDDWHGRGVGTGLLGGLLEVADEWLGLTRLELEVYPDNRAAVGLYEKFGFVSEGCKRRGALRKGQLVDILIMGRLHPPPEPVSIPEDGQGGK